MTAERNAPLAIVDAELMPQDGIFLAGRRWDSNGARMAVMLEGRTVEEMLVHGLGLLMPGKDDEACRRALPLCRVRVDGEEVYPLHWPSLRPKAGSRVEFLYAPAGGGGKKNPLGLVLSLVVVAAAVWAGPALAGYLGMTQSVALAGGGTLTTLTTAGTIVAGVTSAAVMGIGMMAVNALFPPSQASLPDTSTETSQTYSLTGGQNTANPGGYVPLVLGTHRMTPPLGGKSWTSYEGEDQFFHMLVVWGHPDIKVEDFKLGETPLEDFDDVEHIFHQSTTGSDLKLYAKSYNEENVGVVLKKEDGWATRTLGECDEIGFDISFPALGKANKKSGNIETYSVSFEAQYAPEGAAADSDEWVNLGDGAFTISASQTHALTKTYRFAVENGNYQMRLRRTSDDTDDTYIYDDATWSVTRAIVDRPAFSTPEPICCSELRIRASEQLSGYVNDFNAVVTSNVPDWNGTEWAVATTDNPASLLRYLLTSRAGQYKPWSEAKLDEASFVEFWNWCEEKGYTFNFVADTEMTTWKRLVQIAAAGRGNITLDMDGKFSVIIDRADKTPVQMFTPRNSWGFSIDRSYAKLPHALRAEFRNAANGYETDNGYVYADGYDVNSATDIVEWKAEGKTNWDEVWKFGRYYLASSRLRPETISLSTDWEWRLCRRGDLVGVAHDVLMNTFGTARVVCRLYEVDGEEVRVFDEADTPVDAGGAALMPVGVVLDDSIYFSEPDVSYGIAFRLATGRLVTLRLQPQYGQEAWDLYFSTTPAAAQVPPIHALCSVAVVGEEYEEYLVAGITPGENMSADLTLIPYAPEIVDADSGVIPPYSPSIRLDVVPKRDHLPVPSIKEIRADESVLVRSGDSILSCIAAWYGLPSSPDAGLGEIQVQMRAVDDFGSKFTTAAPLSAPYVFVQGVEDGRQYSVRLRLVSAAGLVSTWSDARTVTVIGKTSPPPDVENFTAAIADPQGVELVWDAVTVLDFDHYEVSGAGGDLKTVNPGAVMPVYGRTGELGFSLVAVDTVGNVSSTPATASVEILPPAAPAPSYSVLTDGALVRWADCKTTWSIRHYVVEDEYTGEIVQYADPQFTLSPRPAGRDYAFYLRAVDIFGNSSAVVSFGLGIPSIAVPEPSCSIDGEQVMVAWSMGLSPFTIDHYEVWTAAGALLGKVKTTELRFLAPAAGTHEYRVRAVDIAGNLSGWGECSIVIGTPKAPAVSAALGGDDLTRGADRIELSWTRPAADLPIVAYDVIRQWTETREDGVTETREEDYGRTDALALSVPPVPAGTHSFMVRAVDNSGSSGPWGAVDFVSRAPGKVTFQGCGAVDNNTMLYYTVPDFVYWRVKEYLVEDVDSDGYGYEVGRADVNFFARIENAAGRYTYGVTPVDVAGNLGERSTITINVGQPPDFILYYDVDSVFGGDKVDMELDGRGSMIGPVPSGETWQENAERVAALLGVGADDVTWQAKADGGMGYFVSPAETVGAYSETIDVGTLIPSTKIVVTVSQSTLEGSPVMTCRIEVSADGETWRTATDNGTEVYETSFRYIRVSFTWSGGLVSVSNINVRCDVKRKTDFGKVYCAADDNGEGWVSQTATPMLTGTLVAFNVAFADVESLPRPNVVNDTSDGGLTAYTVFEDVFEPAGFRVFVLDKNGDRASATVDWAAYGV